MNVIEAATCWEFYLKSMERLLETRTLDMKNVAVEIRDTKDKYICSITDIPDPLPWYLRVNSDIVEGELGSGAGLDVRYSQKRLGRVKGHGSYDWDFRSETGRTYNSDLIPVLDENEVFPNIGRLGGNGQLHGVKDLLLLDPNTDKGVISFWNWKRDLVEYTKRKHLSAKYNEDGLWTDAQHQRIPCPVSWHLTNTKTGINNNVYSRSMAFDAHVHDDIFRFTSPADWVGGHMNKESGVLGMFINRLWISDFDRGTRERLEATLEYWTNNTNPSELFPEQTLNVFKSLEEFEEEWLLKELAEQDYRIGAFEEGDRKLQAMKSPYYKDWVRAMKVAEMTISHNQLGRMFRRGIHSRGTKRAMGYIENYTIKRALEDIQGVFRVQMVQWVVNYVLRATFDVKHALGYLELLPEQLREIVLVSSVDKLKKPVVEEVLKGVDRNLFNLVKDLQCESSGDKKFVISGEDEEEVRKPITTGESKNYLMISPYEHIRVNKKHAADIQKLKAEGKIDFCYFPSEPFQRKESKRNAVQKAVEACVENDVPFVIETYQEVPQWAIDALKCHKQSELKIHLCTLDDKKHSSVYSESASVDVLTNSIIRAFTAGVSPVLVASPIIFPAIQPFDVFNAAHGLKHLIDHVEIRFASFTIEEYERVKTKMRKLKVDIDSYYVECEGRMFVDSDYRKSFIKSLTAFLEGMKMKLVVSKELDIKDGEIVGFIDNKE